MDEKRLKILLSLGMDKASIQKASAEFDKFQDGIKALETEAKALQEVP